MILLCVNILSDLYAYRAPRIQQIKLKDMKRRGSLHSLIPVSGSRIASSQDKQHKKPTPRDIIWYNLLRRL